MTAEVDTHGEELPEIVSVYTVGGMMVGGPPVRPRPSEFFPPGDWFNKDRVHDALTPAAQSSPRAVSLLHGPLLSAGDALGRAGQRGDQVHSRQRHRHG